MLNRKLLILCIFLQMLEQLHSHVVIPSCDSSFHMCTFTLSLEYKYTMMDYTDSVMTPIMFNEERKPVYINKTCYPKSPVQLKDEIDKDKIIIGDGIPSLIITFNGTLPGPAIIVYSGQKIVITVKNNLRNEGTTVHFHGVDQYGTPWMDGAGSVSQCNINPGETFMYGFTAPTAGTYWYHTHAGTLRTMGAYGPFIVLPRTTEEEMGARGEDKLPWLIEDFYMMTHDSVRGNSLQAFHTVDNEGAGIIDDLSGNQCYESTKQIDGFDCGVIPFVSGVINGKGRLYDKVSNLPINDKVPLEVFNVAKGGKYRFRVINAAMLFAFRISVDGHTMNIIATDSHDVITRQVQSVIVFSGERYDFWIEATDPQHVGVYWIRAETLEVSADGKPVHAGHMEAILKYRGSADIDPKSNPIDCKKDKKCVILNCPYGEMPEDKNSVCIHPSDLRRTVPVQTVGTKEQDTLVEHFINFQFSKNPFKKWRPVINGKISVEPKSPLTLLHGKKINDVILPCDEDRCNDDDVCYCTHILKLPLHVNVQLVFSSAMKNDDGYFNGNNHPVHVHGTKLQIVQTGFPRYDNTTKVWQRSNTDLNCTTKNCNNMEWNDPSWRQGHIHGLTMKSAPLKDTFVLPIGGYVVTRFYTDNPGYWFLHCHTEFHNLAGMFMILQVGEESDMIPPPNNFPTCGDFILNDDHVVTAANKGEQTEKIMFIIGGTALALSAIIGVLFFSLWFKRYRGYTRIQTK